MLAIEINENKLGAFISGDYHDLTMLYEAFNSVIVSGIFINNSASENYLYSVMYDIRKAMHGEREFDFFRNQLDESTLLELGMKDDISLYYGFNILLSDLLFLIENIRLLEHGQINNKHFYYLRLFLALVCDAYNEEDYELYQSLNNFINAKPSYSFDGFYHQFIEWCTLQLVDCEVDKRLELSIDLLSEMEEQGANYQSLISEVNQYALDNDCDPMSITYIDDYSKLDM